MSIIHWISILAFLLPSVIIEIYYGQGPAEIAFIGQVVMLIIFIVTKDLDKH